MVVVAAEATLPRYEESEGAAIERPRLKLVPAIQPGYFNYRFNPDALYDCPDGHFACLNPECNEPIPDIHAADDVTTCPECETKFSLTDEMREYYEFVDGDRKAISGLTRTEQGKIAEKLVRGRVLGEYGRVSRRRMDYHSPIDAFTDLNWAVEIKSINARAKNMAFAPNPEQIASKNTFAIERGYRGILGVLVVMNFRHRKADFYVRAFERGEFKYFSVNIAKEEPLRKGVKFDFKNPYTQTRTDEPLDCPF